jgi:hypothetical protein
MIYTFVGNMSQSFEIISQERGEYRDFNNVGTQLTMSLNPTTDPATANSLDHFAASMSDVFEHALQGAVDGDMVGVAIRNDVNQNDRTVGISFRRRNQLSADVIWSVFERVDSRTPVLTLSKL